MYKPVAVSVLILMLATPFFLKAQQVQPKGYFLEDSIRIGMSTPFVLTVRYPKELDIIFPDSLYNFTPYELDDKWYTTTLSDDSLSYDSAVYYLTSFEIDSIQYHQMPVFLLQENDSITLLTAKDSVFLKHAVTEIPDSVAAEAMPLKENTSYKRVILEFNYPYVLIGSAIVLIAASLLFIFYGEPVRKKIIMRRLTKGHRQFLKRYEAVVEENIPYAEKAARVLNTWKMYLEKLEKRPYTKLTSKEIIQNYSSEAIKTALQGIDKAIYAMHSNGELTKNFDALKRFSEERFRQKLMEVKNG